MFFYRIFKTAIQTSLLHKLILFSNLCVYISLCPADVQPLLVRKEAVPLKEQEWRPHLDQKDKPVLLHIKEEEEELWSSQEGEQHHRLEEADIAKMSRFQDLKELFKWQLLTAAREDLIGHFETTVSRYEEKIDHQQKLLDVVLKPEVKLRRAGLFFLLLQTC